MINCSKCHKEIENTDKFCKHCGSSQEVPEEFKRIIRLFSEDPMFRSKLLNAFLEVSSKDINIAIKAFEVFFDRLDKSDREIIKKVFHGKS
jgi:hypothetical protein